MKITVEFDLSNEYDCRKTLAKVETLIKAYIGAPVGTNVSSAPPVKQTTANVPSDVAENNDTSPNMGTNARLVIDTIVTLARSNGEATLEQVASTLGSSVATVRAHLMNAARSLRSAGKSEPYVAQWNHDRQCVVYTLAA